MNSLKHIFRMKRFGLIGNPIAHSKSPALFKAAYSGEDSYELIEADNLEASMDKFLNSNFKGINVTSPYKDVVMQYVTCPDRISSLLGSANVLLKGDVDANGRMEILSYNTDYYGVKNTISEILSENESVLKNVRDKEVLSVLVLGAGGAGKAAALAMCDMGYKVFLANRSAGKVAEYAEMIGAEYIPLDAVAEVVKVVDIVVYSLSFLIDGLKGADLCDKIVFEANYAHPVLAPECGVVSTLYIDGRWWLYNQAIPAFELFTGKTPNILNMREMIGLK